MMHKNTINKAKRVQELAYRYYEPGNASKCWMEVYRRHIYEIYPISYSTFKRMMAVDVDAELKRCEETRNRVPVIFSASLFDDEDFL